MPTTHRSSIVDSLWLTDILGSRLRLDGVPYTIVGVTPATFAGSMGGNVLPAVPTEVWMPYRSSPVAESMHLRGLRTVSVIGKLAEGVSLDRARQDVDAAWFVVPVSLVSGLLLGLLLGLLPAFHGTGR